MLHDSLFLDTIISKKITPYQKIRKFLGLSSDTAAESLHVARSTLYMYESGNLPIPKNTIKRMDRLYGCDGRLIDYWLEHDLCASIWYETQKKRPTDFEITDWPL